MGQLKHVDPTPPPGLFRRAYASLANTRLGRFLSVHVVWKVDPYLMRATGGRLGMGLFMPTALLETRGAKSGARAPQRRHLLPRRQPGHDRRLEARTGESPGLVSQPPRRPRRQLRRHPDAGDDRRRRGRARTALVARRSRLSAVRGLPPGGGEGRPDDSDRPARREGTVGGASFKSGQRGDQTGTSNQMKGSP